MESKMVPPSQNMQDSLKPQPQAIYGIMYIINPVTFLLQPHLHHGINRQPYDNSDSHLLYSVGIKTMLLKHPHHAVVGPHCTEAHQNCLRYCSIIWSFNFTILNIVAIIAIFFVCPWPASDSTCHAKSSTYLCICMQWDIDRSTILVIYDQTTLSDF